MITGISQGQYLVNAVAAGGKELVLLKRKRVGRERPGTGDVFSSVVAGAYVRGWDLTSAVGLAADFVKECIRISEKMDIPVANGVCFEEILDQLIRAVRRCEEAF